MGLDLPMRQRQAKYAVCHRQLKRESALLRLRRLPPLAELRVRLASIAMPF
jgi:hypothetical protein